METETDKEKVREEEGGGSTKERRDVPQTQRDCWVKLPLAVSTVHLPLLQCT